MLEDQKPIQVVPINTDNAHLQVQAEKQRKRAQMENQKERRFYYVRVINVQNIHDRLCNSTLKSEKASTQNFKKTNKRISNEVNKSSNNIYDKLLLAPDPELNLSFKMSTALSQTSFRVGHDGKIAANQKQKLKSQSHMLSFNENELMEVKLFQKNPPKEQFLKQEDQYNIGYMKIFLTPLLEEPHTRHRVKVNMRFANIHGKFDFKENQQKKKNMELAATLTLQIFYLLKFDAYLEISPIKAHLKNNPAQLGLLRPRVILYMNNQVKKSIVLDNGGIHPHWNQEADRIRQAQREEEQNQNKEKQKQNIDQTQKQQILNIFKFHLTSVTHILRIQVINFPYFGSDPQIIGFADLRLEERNFFLSPGLLNAHQTDEHSIKLYCWKLSNNNKLKEKVQAGSLIIASHFIFDTQKLRKQIDSESESQHSEESQDND